MHAPAASRAVRTGHATEAEDPRPEDISGRQSAGSGAPMPIIAQLEGIDSVQNPRYTGHAIFGRPNKHEELLDPDDVAAGHITRLRRSPNHRIIRSRKPAHPAIVSVETFTQAQLIRR
ncbi:hypothetical protein [Nocardia xishanensis]|uniref:Uncharacterized protein n=1 Tax=Nocardia xishanensis TaxID=238964 RepID=A0ABW7XBV2_9NOCA